MKIAVTGASGQLGRELVKQGCLPLQGRLMSENLTSNIRAIKPDTIINCAAMTDVDGCEKEPLMAAAVNMGGVEYLNTHFNGHLIHISTDYVFDGQIGPYWVRADPNPINVYGWSKLGGELIARRYKGPSLIVRTTILFSSTKNNFVAKIVAQLAEGKEVVLYNPDITGTPTYVPSLASEIIRLAREEYTGLAHVAGKRVLSRLTFAAMIAEIFGHDLDMITPVEGTPPGARRPKNAGLICDHTGYKQINSHDPIDGLYELSTQKGAFHERPMEKVEAGRSGSDKSDSLGSS